MIKRGGYYGLYILFNLVMDYYEIIEVLYLWTLYHDRLADVHVLRFCPADYLTAFKAADCSGGVEYPAVLDDINRH